MIQIMVALRVFVFMTAITGVIYPLLITLIAQFTMPHPSNGSLISNGDRIVGSALIAQHTTDEKYFWPRPSAIDYDPLKPSGGSNLGPTSRSLKAIVNERKEKYGDQAPVELLFASGSGLDPHISPETAYYQIPRIAAARNIEEEVLKSLVDSRLEGYIGSKYVNVLLLNMELDGN